MNSIIRRILPCSIHRYTNMNPFHYKSYHLSVEPHTCAHDVPVSVRATGLDPNENVTVTATTTDDKGEQFFSYAYFKADALGCVDLAQHKSQGGTYEGLLPMGLISSLQHVEIEKRYQMYRKINAEFPMKLNFNVSSGFMNRDDSLRSITNNHGASIPHERQYVAKGTKRIPIRVGKIRGTLFIPPGKGPFPGIVDMYGGNGGLKESRAAILSTNGFAVLALAYFKHDDLPITLKELHLEYFEEAINLLLHHDEILSDGVGILGLSYAAGLSITMATYLKNIKVVVAMSGFPAGVIYWPIKYKDMVIPAIEPDFSKLKIVNNVLIAKNYLADSTLHPKSVLPLERVEANVLFLVGRDDQIGHTFKENQRAFDRIRKHGRSTCEMYTFDGTGHMIEPPFSQFCDRFLHVLPEQYWLCGGQLNEHTTAEQIVWPKVVAFFKSNLLKVK